VYVGVYLCNGYVFVYVLYLCREYVFVYVFLFVFVHGE